MKPGTKHSHESIEKMRISKSGSNNPNFGKQRSVCTRKKISGALMGHVIDESTKNKISKSLSGPLNANFGNRTQEHNRKISLSQLGKPANQETISKSIETKLEGSGTEMCDMITAVSIARSGTPISVSASGHFLIIRA
jgi:hypothetical protein